ncbi:MAG: MFS transporter, partial [Actinomycetota bacterium]|nr:MFS transporter [Actinomycetota bacterium]
MTDRTGPAARSLPALLRARAADAAVAMHDPQLARLVLTFGAWITAQLAFLIVVSVLAYDKGGAAAVGLTGAVRVLPAAVLGPLVAVALDRLPRPRVLAGVHLSWLLVALATAWLAATDAPLGSLLVVLGLGSVTLSVFKPYVNAMIPQVVTSPSQLIVANSACSTIDAVGTVLGPVLTGLVLATFDPAVALLVLAFIFALGAAAASGIQTEFQPPRRGSAGSRSVLLEPLRGFQVLVAQPGTRTVYGLFMLQTMMRG